MSYTCEEVLITTLPLTTGVKNCYNTGPLEVERFAIPVHVQP
ncbi:MAG: hypothetical protein JWN12_643 [Candidatus Saccharibacteria bacterium]|nr:hypothetical protein [Candidatus Saccharibacteria bacterium]